MSGSAAAITARAAFGAARRAGRGRCAACSTCCCRRTACSARPWWTRRGRSAPVASPGFPLSPNPVAPAAACPFRAPPLPGGASLPLLRGPPAPVRGGAGGAPLRCRRAAPDPAVQAWRPDGVRRAARPAHGTGGRGAARAGGCAGTGAVASSPAAGAALQPGGAARGAAGAVSRGSRTSRTCSAVAGPRRRSAKPARRSGRSWWPGRSPCLDAGRRGLPVGGCCWWTTC